MDSQWPRWEVFKQDTPGKPHQAVGSVHAVDPRHALVTARTLFARRPSAVSMWVVRAEDVFARTAEELEMEGQPSTVDPLAPLTVDSRLSTYLAFRKTSSKRSMTFVDYAGEVEASSVEKALDLARAAFAEVPALVWWLVPASAVTKSAEDEETVESWFAPAKDKTYRQQSSYGVVGAHASKRKGRDEHE